MNCDDVKINCICEDDSEACVILLSSTFMTDKLSEIKSKVDKLTETKYDLYELAISNWDEYLTPWEDNTSFANRNFGGKAVEVLDVIKSDVIPKINGKKIYIAGYSLAGLFSLWSVYESDLFEGCASCSGSFWYPGWKEYIGDKNVKTSYIYLSLGSGEKKTKNKIMSTVEDMTSYQEEKLLTDDKVKHIVKEMNSGGHFNDVELRIAKGIAWLLNNME